MSSSSGGFAGALDWIFCVCNANANDFLQYSAHVEKVSAIIHPLPDDIAGCFFTDPPYYDAVPYADLSDFFYVWLKRAVGEYYPDLFANELTPKEEECIMDEIKGKDRAYFEETMRQAMAGLSPRGLTVTAGKKH